MIHAGQTFRAIAMAALVSAPVAGHVQPQIPVPQSYSPLIDPQTYAAPQGGVPVTFVSSQDGSQALLIPGVLFKPIGTPKGAVVIVNAAGGWSDGREGHYGRSLSSAGYAVLAIDTYGPRGVANTQADNATLTTFAQARDAFAARRYLISIGYPADRTAVMGTGRGGTIALLAADRTFVKDEKERFALAMAITAGCVFHPREPKPGSNIFLAIGEKDDIAGVKPCQSLASEYAAAGGKVTVKVYPGAANGFDGHPANVRMLRDPASETFVDCNVPVEPDGRSTYGGKSFAESDSGALIVEMRKSCIKLGAAGWTNVSRKANLTLDLIEFLDANFRR
jgi:dienelactone hydrolase